jgi:uncharacterized protein (TIGR03437 family)
MLAATAPGYYHFVQFQTRTAPYAPVYARFDLTSVPQNTVPFFISEQGPTQLATGDSFTAVVSQIRAAAQVWSTVGTSDLRLGFGGLHTPGTPMSGPWIEVEFSDEIPPGVVAQGGPVSRLDPANGPNGVYVPIVKSLLRLPKNLSSRSSGSESFFLTLVHEFGHTIGLQHSWTSGAMSTEITRATTKARPLDADDIAGISVLYPGKTFRDQTGAISGRVVLGTAGVNLASVVAFSPNRPAVSALTNPDGTYRIEGLQPGMYFIYAHPLPPSLSGEPQPVNLELPTDLSGKLLPGSAFDTVFYPGTSTPQQAISVSAGQVTDSINFNVNRRNSVNLYAVQTYSYFGNAAAKPGTFVVGSARGTAVMAGYGVAGTTPGLSVSLAGGAETVAPNGMRAHPSDSRYLLVDFTLSPLSAEGPRHLIFTQGGETFVLPSGLSMVPKNPPTITAATLNPDRTLTLMGTGLSTQTVVSIDGVQARIKSSDDSHLVVAVPPAVGGYRATVTALNPDGQSSQFFSGSTLSTFTYDSGDTPQYAVNPSSLPAGVETLLEVTGTGMSMDDWPARLGLGSSDISVRRVWATGPGRILAQVSVSAQATSGPVTTSLLSGLQMASFSGGFQVLPSTRQPYVMMSAMPSGPYYAGGVLSLPLANVSPVIPASSFTATVADRPAAILGYSSGVLNIQVPSGTPSGPAVIRLTMNGDSLLPAIVQIDIQPPLILTAVGAGGQPYSSANPVRAGDTIQLQVSSLVDGTQPPDASRVRVTSPNGSSTLDHGVQVVTLHPTIQGVFLVQVVISPLSPSVSTLPLTLTIDDRSSSAFPLPLRQ